MICTAPCIPRCNNEATHELFTKSSGAYLGCNCEAHIDSALKINDGKDYSAKPLVKGQDDASTN